MKLFEYTTYTNCMGNHTSLSDLQKKISGQNPSSPFNRSTIVSFTTYLDKFKDNFGEEVTKIQNTLNELYNKNIRTAANVKNISMIRRLLKREEKINEILAVQKEGQKKLYMMQQQKNTP